MIGDCPSEEEGFYNCGTDARACWTAVISVGTKYKFDKLVISI